MSSIRNTPIDDDLLLDAARDCLLAVGWRRTTMTDVARRAGVSRMTVYRRWPDMQMLIADLMTRELTDGGTRIDLEPDRVTARELARTIADVARSVRENDLFRKVVDVDPELLLPYLLVRRGRTQDTFLDSLEIAIAAGQRLDTVRSGDTDLLARTVLLATYGFVFSAHTMAEPAEDDRRVDTLFDELAGMLEGYLS